MQGMPVDIKQSCAGKESRCQHCNPQRRALRLMKNENLRSWNSLVLLGASGFGTARWDILEFNLEKANTHLLKADTVKITGLFGKFGLVPACPDPAIKSMSAYLCIYIVCYWSLVSSCMGLVAGWGCCYLHHQNRLSVKEKNVLFFSLFLLITQHYVVSRWLPGNILCHNC